VNREFGSGGGRIAQTIAGRLGWKLLDRDIIDAIAYAAHVETSVVRHYDEHVDSWLRRFNQQAMRSGRAGRQRGTRRGLDLRCRADGETGRRRSSNKPIPRVTASLWADGSQCILQHKPDVYHVFVYAPHKERILRLRLRLEKDADPDQRIRKVDEERAKYLQQYFGKNWCNPHLYDLMISSHVNEIETARAILYAMTGQAEG